FEWERQRQQPPRPPAPRDRCDTWWPPVGPESLPRPQQYLNRLAARVGRLKIGIGANGVHRLLAPVPLLANLSRHIYSDLSRPANWCHGAFRRPDAGSSIRAGILPRELTQPHVRERRHRR